MDKKEIIKKSVAIIFSIFMGNGLFLILGLLFPAQLNAVLPSNANIRSFVVELAGAFISLGLIILFHKIHVLKITGKSLAEGLVCGISMIIIYLIILVSGLLDIPGKTLIPANEIVFVALTWILIGIAEEGLFRGVVQELFMDIFGTDTRKGVFLSIICSGTVFGLTHFQNLLAGVSFPFVLIQASSAIAAGLMFGAIAFRSGRSIWPMVIIHALIDASGFIHGGMLWGASQTESINRLDVRSLIMIPVFIGIFIFLMRKSKTDKLIDKEKAGKL